LKGKKPWKTFVDPLGGHIVMSCLKDNQPTPKHLYINVFHALEDFKKNTKKNKGNDIFTYTAKGEFELKVEVKNSGDLGNIGSQGLGLSGLGGLGTVLFHYSHI
jgi:hypothetical protein